VGSFIQVVIGGVDMPTRLRAVSDREHPLECDHCHYPIPGDPEEGDDGRFCSTACREAAADGSTLADPDAYKRVVTGVEPIDSLVPAGVPTDSLVLLSGEAGTRRTELGIELAWRALERGEPAVVVSAADPPTATLERFYANGWNVLPALETDRLRILDCFTHRLDDREDLLEARADWATFLGEAAADAVVAVDDPGDRREVADALRGALDDLGMTGTGLVTIDSLDELEAVLGDRSVRDVLADVRATVCKARFVPIVAAATAAGSPAESVFDGIIDLRLTDRIVADARRKRLAVRKLTGAQFLPQWVTYEHEPARGLFAFGPTTDARQVYDVDDGRQQPPRPR
jgi:KaiC/GvpD/RAD55 family RecA-like ATPase